MDNRQLNFSHLLYLTAHHWRLAVNRRLKDLGMSQASWVAVSAIARNEKPLSQSELAQELGVESATLVPLLNRLVDLGLVERVKTERDKRKRLLIATAKGLEVYQQVKTVADDLREEILTAITPEEQQQTQQVLEKLLREVEKNNASPTRQSLCSSRLGPARKTSDPRLAVDPDPQYAKTHCLRDRRAAGMPDRRVGQCGGDR